MSNKHKTKMAVLLVAIGATLLFIWGHSLVPAKQSQSESDTVRWLLGLLLGDSALVSYWMELLDLRKVAHFAEFFLLGAEVSALRRLHKTPAMWLYGLGVAAVDELLQFAAPGRAPMVTDVLLDYSGYLCGFGALVALFAVVAVFRRRKQK